MNTNHELIQRKMIMDLMAKIEEKSNENLPKSQWQIFECRFPELTEIIWDVLDKNGKMSFLVERLNKIYDDLNK